MTLAELQQKAKLDGAAVARVGVLVSGLQDRKSARGTRFFRMNISDPTGQVSGMALFPEDFDACRRVFDQTHQVVMTLEARFAEGQFDPVARSVAPMEAVVADAGGAGLRIHVESDAAIASVAALLTRMVEEAKIRSRGPVSFCIADRETGEEVEVSVGRDFPVTPQIKGAIKAMGGVVLVEELCGAASPPNRQPCRPVGEPGRMPAMRGRSCERPLVPRAAPASVNGGERDRPDANEAQGPDQVQVEPTF